MIFDWLYMAGLGAALCFALSRAHPSLDRTALTIAGNWCAGTIYVLSSGVDDPVVWFALIDFLAAIIILKRPATYVQGFVGATYLMQITIHTGYLLASYGHAGAGYASAHDLYLNVLTWVGWTQLIALFLWAGGHGRKARYFRRLRHPDGHIVTTHRSGDER